MSGPARVRPGVTFAPAIAEALDARARDLFELEVDRGEIVNAILGDFFDGNGAAHSVWSAVNRRRRGRRP